MKPLKHTMKADLHAYMHVRQLQNRAVCKWNRAENWMAEKLDATEFKWTRQAQWGYRLFDFWCDKLGIAVEVDGPEHNKSRDEYRDRYNLHRSSIIVLRVRNFNEEDAQTALNEISKSETWVERKSKVKLSGTQLRKVWQYSTDFKDLEIRMGNMTRELF